MADYLQIEKDNAAICRQFDCARIPGHEGLCSKKFQTNTLPQKLGLTSYKNQTRSEIYKEEIKRAEHKNKGKPMVHLPGYAIIRGIAFVLEWAANSEEKYELHNWRTGMPWSEVLASAIRHLEDVCDGEWLDPESGKPHVWHAATNLMFLIQYMDQEIGEDDIYRRKNE